MPLPLIVPALLALGLVVAASDDGDNGTPSEGVLTPDGVDALTEIRHLPGGGTARFFRATARDAIVQMLALMQINLLGPQNTGPGGSTVFELTPPGGSLSPDARTAALAAQASGLVVLASLSTGIPTTSERKQLAIGPASAAATAQPGSPWAILLEVTGLQPGLGLPGGFGPTTLPGNAPQIPVPGQPDANMSADAIADLMRMLSDPAISPDALELAAVAMDQLHFPKAAQMLRDRAAALRAKSALDDAKRGGTPFTIRGGDIASNLAKYYTGNANRWKEIVAANQAIGMTTYKDPNTGWTQLKPWNVGDTILLPIPWNASSKPLPPPLTSPAAKAATAKSNGTPIGPPPPPAEPEVTPGEPVS